MSGEEGFGEVPLSSLSVSKKNRETDAVDRTDKAYAAITATLELWTSPKVTSLNSASKRSSKGSRSIVGSWTSSIGAGERSRIDSEVGGAKQSGATQYTYERDSDDWWNRELSDKDEPDVSMEEEEIIVPPQILSPANASTVKLPLSTPPKRASHNDVRESRIGTQVERERADTPVMSNSSKKKQKTAIGGVINAIGGSDVTTPLRRRQLAIIKDDEDSSMFPVNIQSPWLRQQQQELSQADEDDQSGFKSNALDDEESWMSIKHSSPRAIGPFSKNSSYEYRKYHDILLCYLKARKNVSERIHLDMEGQALALSTQQQQDQDFPIFAGDPNLGHEETRVEMDYLRSLHTLCWDRTSQGVSEHYHHHKKNTNFHSSKKEGDFWLLLCELRKLGLAALVWEDDMASEHQNHQAQMSFIESSARKVGSWPLQLIASLDQHSSDCPLILKRRKTILTWMQLCFEPLIPESGQTSALSKKGVFLDSTKNQFSKRSIKTKESNTMLMKNCLALILAGKLEDAEQLARNEGQAWRAASWGGGKPAGIRRIANRKTQTMETTQVGNVHRALWKRQIYKLSQFQHLTRQLSTSNGDSEEAAIHSLLSNDYQSAISNPSLRSWEKGLYAVFSAMWGRIEDELLHQHNKCRRNSQDAPYPGTQHEKHEREQLQASVNLLSMSEKKVLDMLSASPFEEMCGKDCLSTVISAFLIGRLSITEFLVHQQDQIFSANEYNNNNLGDHHRIANMRFLTHLLLYLDSLSACTTPILFNENVVQFKNRILYEYLHHLADSEDLRYMMPLYASLLPYQYMLECFPNLLVRVEEEKERKQILQQIRDLMTPVFDEEPLDIILLRMVVQNMLSEQEIRNSNVNGSSEDEGMSETCTPTRLDVRKMKSIQWLCFYQEHMGDALIFSNTLLRQFLLAGKIQSANLFVQDFLPDDVLEKAVSGSSSNTDMTITGFDTDNENLLRQLIYEAKVDSARSEHIAYQSYLNSFRAVEMWQEVLDGTPATFSVIDDKLETNALNETEKDIVHSMERRDLIRQKRQESHIIVEVADNARKDLMTVLKHPGGWLYLTAEEEEESANNTVAKKRLNDQKSKESQERRYKEIQDIRCKYLPHVVSLFQKLCTETASWMSKSLDDCIPELGQTPEEVLQELDKGGDTLKNTNSNSSSRLSLSPLSPKYWIRQALNVVEVIATDAYSILDAFNTEELKEIFGRMAEMEITEQMYSV